MTVMCMMLHLHVQNQFMSVYIMNTFIISHFPPNDVTRAYLRVAFNLYKDDDESGGGEQHRQDIHGAMKLKCVAARMRELYE